MLNTNLATAQDGGQKYLEEIVCINNNIRPICSGAVSFESCRYWEEKVVGGELMTCPPNNNQPGKYQVILMGPYLTQGEANNVTGSPRINQTFPVSFTFGTTYTQVFSSVNPNDPAPIVNVNLATGYYAYITFFSNVSSCNNGVTYSQTFPDGSIGSFQVSGPINATQPTLAIINTPTPICAGSEVCFRTDFNENGTMQFQNNGPTFEFKKTTSNGNVIRSLYDNINNTVIPLQFLSYNTSGQEIVKACFTYPTAGNFQARRFNRGACGGNTLGSFVFVNVIENKVNFTALVDCNGNVTFTPTVQCASPTPATFNWVFGDGSTGQSQSNQNNGIITHQYATASSFNVSVSANSGASVSQVVNTVTAPTLALTALYGDLSKACSPTEQYTLTGLPAGYTANWAIQGGNVVVNNQTTATVTWTATRQDVDGNSAMGSYLAGGTISVIVSNGICSYSLVYNVDECCATNSINFTNINSRSGETKATDLFTGAVITNKKYYVEGRLIIDKNLTFNNCWLKMGPYAEIIVTGGNKLTTNLTTITAGCSIMWQHIYVEPSAELELNNRTHIEDGITAVFIAENAKYTINQTVFNKNYDAMLIDGSPTAGSTVTGSVFAFAGANITTSYGTITDVFVNNLSFPAPGLRYPFANQRSNNGIFVQFCKEITQFGEPSNGSQNLTDRNTFYQLKFGINARMSNIHIYNNEFLNIFDSQTKENETAINVLGNTRDSKTNYSVLIGGTTAKHGNYFNFCEAGAVTYYNVNSSTRNNKFSKVERGLSISTNRNNNNVTVYNNSFDNCGFGVLCHYNTYSTTTIHFNTMKFTDVIGIMEFGISVNDEQSKTGVYTIANNTIESALNGIMVNATLGAKVNNNTIKLAYDYYLNARGKPKTAGIVLSNSPLTAASCNTINCFTSQNANETDIKGNTNSKGIEVLSSNTLNLDNNSVNIMGAGIDFTGTCDATKVFKNDFNKVGGGIIMQNNAIIGPQGNNTATTSAARIASDNTWQGGITNSPYRLYDGGNNTPNILSNSPFYYRTTAQKYDVNNNYNLGNFTVAPTVTSRNDLPCGALQGPQGPGGKSLVAKEKLAKGEINFGINDTEQKWMGKADVFDMMLNDDSLGLVSTVLANFKDSADYSNIAKLRHARKTNNDSLNNKNAIAVALAINNSIAPNNSAEEVYKQINAVVAQSLLNDTIFVASQLDSLRAIAALCPYTDGLGVYEARALLVFYDTLGTDYTNACELPQQANNRLANRETNASSTSQEVLPFGEDLGGANIISISPNPSTGSFIVSSNLNTLKNVEVYDVSGRLLSSTENQNEEKQIKVESLQLKAGVYWVKSTNNKGETTINKLLITN